MESNLVEFFKYFGYDISIFVIIVAAYFEMNAVSVIHIFLASFFALFSYVVNSRAAYSARLLHFVSLTWKTINYLIFFDLTRKYLTSIWFPQTWAVVKPWENATFNCDQRGNHSSSSNQSKNDFQ